MTMARTTDPARLRADMVATQVAGRGVRSASVLDALRAVSRELFVPEHLREFAYEDVRLPLVEGATIPRPWTVGAMAEALGLHGNEQVLEVGTGCGYVAAVLARLVRSVYSVEPVEPLALGAAAALRSQGIGNVHLLHGPAATGWPDHAPYDAVLVNLPGPRVPEALKQQLKVGGCLVMPVGVDAEVLELVRVRRTGAQTWQSDDIEDLRAGAVLGEEDHAAVHAGPLWGRPGKPDARADSALAQAIAARAERFATPGNADLEPLLRRIGDARIVLLGESTHGTAEFYRMRDQLSRELITRKGFSFVAIEGDWPDAARIDHHVRDLRYPAPEWTAFARFPTWMWRNREMRSFVDWLRLRNEQVERPVAFHGLDLYSLYASIRAVLAYLDEVDAPTAKVARQRYGCLTPWQSDPAAYGSAALTQRYRTCEREVVAILADLLARRPLPAAKDGERYFDALQNARLVANAERYYRVMYYGSRAAWNLRDRHMFDTLKRLLAFHGPDSKGLVWAHNAHIGDSSATEMSLRGEFNMGHLCRRAFGRGVYSIGFGTHSGTVAAASDWDAPMEVKTVQPALAGSYERLFHEASTARFLLPLTGAASAELLQGLSAPRLERAIGVVYRPETERQSHYFDAVLARQFDEYIWFDETHAITPLKTEEIDGLPETYPFGL
jgi:protein-L-isoaspartate(D-aspartate) O-methyltransferase